MINIYSNEQWALDARKTLNFLISRMGEKKWLERKTKIVSYFLEVENRKYSETEILNGNMKEIFSPIALYEDWIAWYMYLVENIFDRPYCGDSLQSARIFPFFSMIGQNLLTLLEMDGIEIKIEELLNQKKNQPDAVLFELAVANLYSKNGYKVCFIPESTFYKSPDLQVKKDGIQYWVECKRMQKVSDYAENERLEWQKRSVQFTSLIKKLRYPCHIDIKFKVPVSDTEVNILVDSYRKYEERFGTGQVGEIKNSEVEILFSPLDINSINNKLETNYIKNNSPELIEVCIGKYSSGGNYAAIFDYEKFYKLGPTDDLEILNTYVEKVSFACIMEWSSISEYSIDLKAKDVKRLLVKAVNQLPLDGPGIIHIGYENLDGPYVERKRFLKTQSTIQNFDYKDKHIQAVYCNCIQLLATSNNFDWAETTCYYKRAYEPNLEKSLLLTDEQPEMIDPHWEEDIKNLEKN